MRHPEADVRAGEAVSLKQRVKRALDHGDRQVADQRRQDDAQLALALLEPDFIDLLGIEKRFEIDNLREAGRVRAVGPVEAAPLKLAMVRRRSRAQEKRRGPVRADRIGHRGLERVVEVIARRADFHGQRQGQSPRTGARVVPGALQGRQGARTAKTHERGALDVGAKSHVPDQTRAHVRADHEQVHVARGQAGARQTLLNGATPRLHGAPQVTLVQLVRRLMSVDVLRVDVEVPVINIAVEKDIEYPRAVIAGEPVRFLLREPVGRVRDADGQDSGIARLGFPNPLDPPAKMRLHRSRHRLPAAFGGGSVSLRSAGLQPGNNPQCRPESRRYTKMSPHLFSTWPAYPVLKLSLRGVMPGIKRGGVKNLSRVLSSELLSSELRWRVQKLRTPN